MRRRFSTETAAPPDPSINALPAVQADARNTDSTAPRIVTFGVMLLLTLAKRIGVAGVFKM